MHAFSSSLLCFVALFSASVLASPALVQDAAVFETSQPAPPISAAVPTNTDSFDPSAIPPGLQGKVPDGMAVWHSMTDSFAYYRNVACQLGLYRHPRFMYSSWPLIVTIGNDARDICNAVHGPRTYIAEDAMSLFTDYGQGITAAIKITMYSLPDADAAYSYWNSTLSNDYGLQRTQTAALLTRS
ncbi:hypothetical protein BX667DRAFT_515754 [Coemansia mojavensis]|nr:hypothetical protein BX667DRAFT_515754 [Coemansia mojavensis]